MKEEKKKEVYAMIMRLRSTIMIEESGKRIENENEKNASQKDARKIHSNANQSSDIENIWS